MGFGDGDGLGDLWRMSQVRTNPQPPLFFSWFDPINIYVVASSVKLDDYPSDLTQITLVIISPSLIVQVILLSYPCQFLGGRPNRQVSAALNRLSVPAPRALRNPTSVFQLYHEGWSNKSLSPYLIPVHLPGAGPSHRALCRLKGLSIRMPRAPRSLSHVQRIAIGR